MPNTAPKKFVFVLTPFQHNFDDVYKLGIKPACEEAGAYCERVDEQIFHESILERIYNQISKADIIIADMTGQNPNVFYETGYAHALNKKVIHVTQNEADIPFDLKHYPHIIYTSITTLKNELQRRVSWYTMQPDETLLKAEALLKLFINEAPITDNAIVNISWKDIEFDPTNVKRNGEMYIKMRFSIYNPTNNVINVAKLRFGLIFPHDSLLHAHDPIVLPDGGLMEKVNDFGADEIYPGEWRRVTWTAGLKALMSEQVSPKLDVKETNIIYPMTLRMFRASGIKDTKFYFRFPNIPPSV